MTRQCIEGREWKRRLRFCLMAAAALVLAPVLPAGAQEGDEPNAMVPTIQKGRAYSPYAQRNFPTMVLFGDTHGVEGVDSLGMRIAPDFHKEQADSVLRPMISL